MSTDITTKEASCRLKISEQRVRTLCRTNKIKARKLGNSWIIDEPSIREYKLAHHIAEDHPVYNSGSDKKIALSFFSGAMGLDLGIESAGFDIRLTCEVDKFCRQTIAINRPNAALLSDINDYSASDIKKAAKLTKQDDIDLIVGGPPCQAFSTAGKRNGFSDDRGNVFLKFLELCIELKPKYFVIENVRGLLSCPMDHRPHNQRGKGFPNLREDEQKGGALNLSLIHI